MLENRKLSFVTSLEGDIYQKGLFIFAQAEVTPWRDDKALLLGVGFGFARVE